MEGGREGRRDALHMRVFVLVCLWKCLMLAIDTNRHLAQECELRPMNRADGSARFNLSRTSVLAGVFGLAVCVCARARACVRVSLPRRNLKP
jgi:hypothetical protein